MLFRSWLLPYTMDTVYGMVKCPYQTLYTAYEEWAEPNYREFKNLMRIAYTNKTKPSPTITASFLDEYSYSQAGLKLETALNV